MSIIREWAFEHGVSHSALFDLERRLGVAAAEVDAMVPLRDDGKPGSESRQQSLVLLEASQKGLALMRNNVGALKDARGVPVRYGLMNNSKDLNEVIKSADLIGIDNRPIEPHMVGTPRGQFLSVEMKEEGWKYNPNDAHEVAQYRWIQYVLRHGGRAMFATGPGML